MRQVVTADPLAAAIFGCTVLVWLLTELRQALRRRPSAANSDRYSLLLVRICLAVGVLLAALAQRVNASAFAYSSLTFGVSLALLWTGIGLRWWCFHTLGRYFTFAVMTSADQPVIASGPYALVRHPSYAGLLLALSGIGLTFANWLSLVVLLACALVGFVNRMNVEERALAAALGAAYTSYASTRKRIIPFVW